jgi:hypothetical protein
MLFSDDLGGSQPVIEHIGCSAGLDARLATRSPLA